MSKGNIVQGMAHGSLGDMVLSRLNGIQVARVRNRTPRNPRTAKQLYQRAIMATVMRAYTAGSAIFDHSFEGYGKGAPCQHRFFHRNCDNLRAQLAADLQSGISAGAMRTFFGAPKIQMPVPSPFIISEGSLNNGLLTQYQGGTSSVGHISLSNECRNFINAHGGNVYSTYAQKLIDEGLLSQGDIYTVCYFAVDFTSLPEFEVRGYSAECSKQYPGGFGYVRLAFNENVLSNSNSFDIEPRVVGDGTSGANGGILKVTGSGGYEAGVFATRIVETGVIASSDINTLLTPSGTSSYMFGGYMGVIHSRKDTDLRNKCKMIYSAKPNNVFSPFGICSYYVLMAWQQGTETIGVSDNILEA